MGTNVGVFFLLSSLFVVDSSLGNLGRPFRPFFFFFPSIHPTTAPCLMASRGATDHEHDNTDSPTTQYTCLLPHDHIPSLIL